MNRHCYWSIAEGPEVSQVEALIQSARAVGVTEPFHIWSPQAPRGATHHRCLALERAGGIYKLVFLRRAVIDLDYDLYVWLDPATRFVRAPHDLHGLLRHSPIHVPLEGALSGRTDIHFPEAGGLSCAQLAQAMQQHGVRSRTVFSVTGGFHLVRRAAVEHVYQLALEFWKAMARDGTRLGYGPVLAYVMQMLCADPDAHRIARAPAMWRHDRDGRWAEAAPSDEPWSGRDFLEPEPRIANPAIVHLCTPLGMEPPSRG
jgi:hypothetical protein